MQITFGLGRGEEGEEEEEKEEYPVKWRFESIEMENQFD